MIWSCSQQQQQNKNDISAKKQKHENKPFGEYKNIFVRDILFFISLFFSFSFNQQLAIFFFNCSSSSFKKIK